MVSAPSAVPGRLRTPLPNSQRPSRPASHGQAWTKRCRRRARRQVPEGPSSPCAARAGRSRRGFVFAGMRGGRVWPQGTREPRAARCLPARPAPASRHLPGPRRRAVAFVRHISIKLPWISRLNNSTQKESA